jgi:hypothetical protein
MSNSKIFVFSIALFFSFQLVWSQGCSDAGFCTIESFKPGDLNYSENYKNQIRVGVSFGQADYDISILSNYIEFSRNVNDKLRLNSKFTSIYQTGNGISVFGLSDIFLNANYSLTDQVNFTLGAKIPLNNASRQHQGLPLPMDYQSSLGTLDLIAGLGYNINKLQLLFAIQQPLTQNSNEFISGQHPADSELNMIQSTRNYIRKGDLMARISWPFSLSPKLQLNLSLLPIYHLANDQYTDIEGDKKEIEGSRGLTLNSNIFLDYKLNNQNFLQMNFGMPFITRDSRPDGLTRHFLVSLEYGFRF